MSINFRPEVYTTMINNFSKSLVYTPVTKTTDNLTGDEVLTEGSTASISGAFFRSEDSYAQSFEGLFRGADAVLLVLTSVTATKNSLVAYDGEEYRIDKVTTRRLGTDDFYKVARCFRNGDS